MSGYMVEIEGSGRHCHVTQETLEKLFGEGFELEVRRMLTQPGQFATPHKVTVVGERRTSEVSIIGPCRKADQVELSFTDAARMGFEAPIRESGDVVGTPGCILIGPKGSVEIKCGVMIAKRHIHLTPEDAEKFGLADKQIVKVRINSDRSLIYDDVVARVNPEFATFMHVDYDELNAAAIKAPHPMGEILV